MGRVRLRIVVLAVVVGGMALRLVGVTDPLAVRRRAAWREADVGAIAQAFHRESFDPLRPRIAWRGDGPGYVEGEFQFLPLAVAAVWAATGESDLAVRLAAAVVALLTLLVFVRLALRTLSPPGAVAASLVFALNPLLVFLGSAAQPDPVMVLFLLLAFDATERWTRDGAPGTLLAAGAWLGLAILAKATAAHFGLVLAGACLARLGWRALRSPAVWGAAAVALVPGLAWYLWTRGFWLEHGNSLGVSNQVHTLGTALAHAPALLAGVAYRQAVHVFAIAGLALAAVAWWRRPRPAVVPLAVGHVAAALVLFVVVARTAGKGWAFYYHAASVAPACLLVGAGFGAIAHRGVRAAATGALAGRWARLRAAALRPAVLWLLLAGALAVEAVATTRALALRDPGDELAAVRRCVRTLATHVPADGRIVVDGGWSRDQDGMRMAHDRSMLFYFSDRFGFTYASDELEPALLARLAARGGRWWFASRRLLAARPALARSTAADGAVVASCATHSLIDLGAWHVTAPLPPGGDAHAALGAEGR